MSWANSYMIATPRSQAAEKRARRKIAVCRCHRLGAGGSEIAHPVQQYVPDILAKPVKFIVQRNDQGAQQLGALVALDAHHFELFVGHANSFQSVCAPLTVAKAGGAASVLGGGLWK